MTNRERKQMRERLGISGHTGYKIPPSRVHGQKSRKTERRQAKQQARQRGWDA
jgi:hypothetical protein